MLPDQRRREILLEISQQGSVETQALSRQFTVSEMTIRRDLRLLEQEAHLRCTHGGAVYLGTPSVQEIFFQNKAKLYAREKEAIARHAAEHLVADQDIIILDPGTTAGAMVRHLRNRRGLTVITNSLPTVQSLKDLLPECAVLCAGGLLRQASLTFVGPAAESFFEQLNAKTLFLSGIGFSLERGLTDPQLQDTQVKLAMIRAARRVVLLVDSSKLGSVSTYRIMDARAADLLVTDEGASREQVEAFERAGLEVHQVLKASRGQTIR